MNRNVLWAVLLAPALASCARPAGQTETRPVAPESALSDAPSGLPQTALFDGCEGVHRDSQADDVRCASFSLSISRFPQTVSYDEFAVAYRSQNLGPDAAVDETEVTTPHGRYVGFYSPADRHLFVAGPTATGGSLALACTAHEEQPSAQQRCRDAVAYVANHGTPETIQFRSASLPSLAGRTLALDPECKPEGEQRIRCDEGGRQLSWVYARQQQSSLEDLRDELVRELQALGSAAQASLPCRVEGVKTSCLKLSGGREPLIAFYLAIVEVRGERVLVVCSHADEDQEQPPSPCKDVFQLEPGSP